VYLYIRSHWFLIFPVITDKSVRRFSSDTWEDTYSAARPGCGEEEKELRRSYHLGVRTYRIREAVVLYIGLEAEDERGLYCGEKRERERTGKSFLAR